MSGKKTVIFVLIFALSLQINAAEIESGIIPVTKVFHGIGKNVVNSLLFNGGLNFITAALGTYVIIDSGFDWDYNRFVYDHPAMEYSGYPSLFIGYVMPVALPLTFYLIGRDKKDSKLQITGLALAQGLMLSVAYSSVLKGITGRISPGMASILDHKRNDNTENYSDSFDWGFGRRGFIAGWPSAHTLNAFTAAAILSEIYDDSVFVKIASYSYAVFIGLGVSWCVHWSSEVFAGALLGYAIGKTVGRSFRKLLTDEQNDSITFYVTPNMMGVRISMY
jgi:membrane-associated phospholipid phosphatase